MEGKILFDIAHLRFDTKALATINDGFFVLSNDDELRSEYYSEIFVKQFGLADTAYIPKSVFAFSKVTLQSDRQIDAQIQTEFEELMSERLAHLQSLLTFLWFFGDNSIGLFSTIGQIPAKRIVARITKTFGYWTCEGRKENVTYTKEELLAAGALSIIYAKICPGSIKGTRNVILPAEFDQHGHPFKGYLERASNAFDYNGQNSIERAFNFLITARTQTIVIYRIAYYMAAFESLFTTSATEVTLRISYRVAFYIAEKENREKTFQLINDSYNIRSKFLHGQQLVGKSNMGIDELIKVAKDLDEILRKCFKRAILEHADVFTRYENSDRDAFLNNLVFDNIPFDHEPALQRANERDRKLQEAAERKERDRVKGRQGQAPKR